MVLLFKVLFAEKVANHRLVCYIDCFNFMVVVVYLACLECIVVIRKPNFAYNNNGTEDAGKCRILAWCSSLLGFPFNFSCARYKNTVVVFYTAEYSVLFGEFFITQLQYFDLGQLLCFEQFFFSF